MIEILRDKVGQPIGSLRSSGDSIKLFSAGGKFLGSYNKGTNSTLDASGTVIAKCNLLVSLLKF